MWVITKAGFVSLVQDRDDPDILQVRARVSEDITAVFPAAKVYVAPASDYRCRARVNRQEVADALRQAVVDINYDSHFKDHAIATSPPNPERMTAYYKCWDALAQMQDYRPYSRVPRSAERRCWDDDTLEGDGDW